MLTFDENSLIGSLVAPATPRETVRSDEGIIWPVNAKLYFHCSFFFSWYMVVYWCLSNWCKTYRQYVYKRSFGANCTLTWPCIWTTVLFLVYNHRREVNFLSNCTSTHSDMAFFSLLIMTFQWLTHDFTDKATGQRVSERQTGSVLRDTASTASPCWSKHLRVLL